MPMSRRAAMLLLLATTGCTGLDGLGPNNYNAGPYSNGYAADYPADYGPSPGYAGPETYYAPPAYAPVLPVPGVVYGGGGRVWGDHDRDRDHDRRRAWDHDHRWDHDGDRDHDHQWGEHRGGTPSDVAQRQRAIIEQEQRYNQQRALQQQQIHNQQTARNPQGASISREQLIQELATQHQQLGRNTSAIRRQDLGR